MKSIVLCVFLVQCIRNITSKLATTTLRQEDRINLLKQRINDEIREKIHGPGSLLPMDVEDSSIEELEYVQNDNYPITPIMDFDERKKNGKFKLRALKPTVKLDTLQNGGNRSIDNGGHRQLRSNKFKRKRIRTRKPLEIFYRRVYDKDIFGQPLEWVHCQDVITPFLISAKLNISNPKRLNSKDPTVLRFISLLKVNTSAYGREDIYSILYQISNLNLRLFRWDVIPLNILLNVIIKERKHTFANLKSGLRDLFYNWRLDFSNTSTLLKQSRIFRPPCVQIVTVEGSTKSPKITKYPKRLESTTPCDVDEDDC